LTLVVDGGHYVVILISCEKEIVGSGANTLSHTSHSRSRLRTCGEHFVGTVSQAPPTVQLLGPEIPPDGHHLLVVLREEARYLPHVGRHHVTYGGGRQRVTPLR
jgi:hypothetical protein